MSAKRKIGAAWGIVGFTILISGAVMRLTPHIHDAFQLVFTPLQWAVLVVWVGFMAVGEGYKGFQKQFSPRFAARTWHLLNQGRTIDLFLAPLYCVGYYHGTRKRMISSWSLSAGIIVLILIVVQFPEPWRGIIDTGVVLGLVYGLAWVYIYTWQGIRQRVYLVDPEVDGFNAHIKPTK